MALSQRLDLRQSQSLVMTPQLQQAIKLLQLSNLDLAAYLEQELERNPLLRRDEGGEGEPAAGDGGADAEGTADAERGLEDAAGVAQQGEVPLETDYDNGWTDEGGDGGAGNAPEAASSWGTPGGRTLDGQAGPNLEQTVSSEISLRDHLLTQIDVDIADPADRIIATHLVDLLDDAGYLSASLDGVAERLGCDPARIEATVHKLQQLDPPGIFARDLAECLTLQLKDKNRLDPAMQALVDNLDLLGKRDATALKRVCAVDDEDLADMVAEIRSLDPKPALAFDATMAEPVIPDVIVRAQRDGWLIELNNDTLPRVLVDNQYYTRVRRAARGKEEREYLTERLQSANWLVRALNQRANTILKVAEEIVRQQEAFFLRGVQHLRPLVLRDVAEAIEMHESTVSRVTANKYMSTPRGIYELKYFFTAAISSTGGGDDHSAESVRHRVAELIKAESAESVLSDDTIVEKLRAEGIEIARRTVAKYRDAMRIPSSVLRRRQKKSTL